MTESEPPRDKREQWEAPLLENCPQNLSTQSFTESGHLLEVNTGYENSEFQHYCLEVFEVDGQNMRLITRIRTERSTVRQVVWEDSGAVRSEEILFKLTCQQDVPTTYSDATNVAVEY